MNSVLKIQSLLLSKEQQLILQNRLKELYNGLYSEQSSKLISKIDRKLHVNKQLEDHYECLTILGDLLELGYIELIDDYVNNVFLQTKLSSKNDNCNAYVSINSGAGGSLSQDWARMLFTMYTNWCNKFNKKYEILDLNTTEAGINSATLLIKYEYAYGYLKSEIGVHRLIRISPFNAQGKRQTSFASVDVYPEIEDSDIVINDNDLVITTCKGSGAGGQHRNTTDSAVRITHKPSNITVTCQSERSQIQNKNTAMKILKSRLEKLKEESNLKDKSLKESEKMLNSFGSQIRTYTFNPYQLVKDHRTNIELKNIESVMQGNINKFIESFLTRLEKS